MPVSNITAMLQSSHGAKRRCSVHHNAATIVHACADSKSGNAQLHDTSTHANGCHAPAHPTIIPTACCKDGEFCMGNPNSWKNLASCCSTIPSAAIALPATSTRWARMARTRCSPTTRWGAGRSSQHGAARERGPALFRPRPVRPAAAGPVGETRILRPCSRPRRCATSPRARCSSTTAASTRSAMRCASIRAAIPTRTCGIRQPRASRTNSMTCHPHCVPMSIPRRNH